MKISKIKLNNFRSYQEEIIISFQDMNIILGKNDAGKSTILEALDIFFNEKGCVSIELEDLNKTSALKGNTTIEITVCFKDFEDQIILESVPTSVTGEYLLNKEGELEIKKVYSGAKMSCSTFIVANHPANDTFIKGLLLEKIKDLQKYVKDNSIHVEGKESVSCDLRSAIRKSYGNLQLETQSIPADKEGAKEIWEKIQVRLPAYSLFQADRSNTDQDSEVQNPMAIALKNILSEPGIAQKLSEVFEEVKKKTEEVAKGTLLQLHKINATLADQLTLKPPSLDKLKWSSAFPKTEIESDNISLNKKGSGVKRMILLSFFLNEVERRKREDGLSDIIYAFEEPETSQHPEHQEILINAFRTLSRSGGCQVMLTTHSPYVYKDCIKDKTIQLIHVGNKIPKTVDDIRSNLNNLPNSPTWGEINHFVYGLYTYEFFDELYSHMEEICPPGFGHVDDFIVDKTQYTTKVGKSEKWQRSNKDGTPYLKDGQPVICDSTYITCLRHQIHHPNNRLNTTDFKPKLSDAISEMLNVIKEPRKYPNYTFQEEP